MPTVNAQKQLDKRRRESTAATDPDVIKGEVPETVLGELVHAKTAAKDTAGAFADAVKAQAAKYGIKPAALSKYVTAREADKLDAVRIETEQLVKLMD